MCPWSGLISKNIFMCHLYTLVKQHYTEGKDNKDDSILYWQAISSSAKICILFGQSWLGGHVKFDNF